MNSQKEFLFTQQVGTERLTLGVALYVERQPLAADEQSALRDSLERLRLLLLPPLLRQQPTLELLDL